MREFAQEATNECQSMQSQAWLPVHFDGHLGVGESALTSQR